MTRLKGRQIAELIKMNDNAKGQADTFMLETRFLLYNDSMPMDI